MFNMYTMLHEENSVSDEERQYATWLREVESILKCPPIEEGSKADDDAFDLYSDGCTPAEAAEELSA